MNLIDLKDRIAILTVLTEAGTASLRRGPLFTVEERDFLLDAINMTPQAQMGDAHDPGNYLGRIDALYAALSIDDGGEGLIAAPVGTMTLPLVAADKRRLDIITPIARQVGRAFGKVVRIAKFSNREDIEIIRP